MVDLSSNFPGIADEIKGISKFSISRNGIHLGYGLGLLFDSLTKNPSALVYRARNGITLPFDSEMFRKIYEQYGEFLPRRGEAVVDVGAQYADYAIICNKLYGASVTAFEPLRVNFNRALYLIRKNRADVEIHNMGLSDVSERVGIHSNNYMLRSDGTGDFSEEVQFVKMDDLNLQPDLFKIDVEGFEMNVLRGATNTISHCRPRIIIETHSSLLEKGVNDFLSAMGYSLKHEFGRIKGEGWMDTVVNLFFLPKDQL